MENKKSTHGGAGRGQGSKPKYDDELVLISIKVPKKHKEEIHTKFRAILETYKIA
jgi:hypothetical protein